MKTIPFFFTLSVGLIALALASLLFVCNCAAADPSVTVNSTATQSTPIFIGAQAAVGVDSANMPHVFKVDGSGNLLTAGGGGDGGTVTIASPIGINTTTNSIPVTIASNQPSITVSVSNPVSTVTVANPVTTVTVSNPTSTVTVANPITTVTVSNPVTTVTASVSNFPATQTVSGTVTANQGGALWNVSVPVSTTATILTATTSTSGAAFVTYPSTTCLVLDVVNVSGTTIEYQRGGVGNVMQIPNNGARSIVAITNANQVGIRRTDQSGTSVTISAEAITP